MMLLFSLLLDIRQAHVSSGCWDRFRRPQLADKRPNILVGSPSPAKIGGTPRVLVLHQTLGDLLLQLLLSGSSRAPWHPFAVDINGQIRCPLTLGEPFRSRPWWLLRVCALLLFFVLFFFEGAFHSCFKRETHILFVGGVQVLTLTHTQAWCINVQ